MAVTEEEYAYERLFDRNYGMGPKQQQELIRKSTVAVAGTGGVGGITAELLTRMGIGSLRLADPEEYEPTNNNRQVGATARTWDRNKAHVMGERCKGINPCLDIKVYEEGITQGNIASFLEGVDIIIDGIDYYAPGARLLLYQKAKTNIISPPAVGFGSLIMNFSPEGYWIDELFNKEKGQFITDKLLAGAKSTPQEFFERVRQGTIPTYPPAVYLSGVLASNEALATLTHKEGGSRQPIIMPLAMRLDLYDRSIKIIDMREV